MNCCTCASSFAAGCNGLATARTLTAPLATTLFDDGALDGIFPHLGLNLHHARCRAPAFFAAGCAWTAIFN